MPSLGTWVGPAVSAVAFVFFLVWTWGKWPDFLIDFGREAYVPWQLLEGKTLYADLAYFHGPLSPTWNAVMFRLFGTSLRALFLSNAAVLAGVAVMVHHLLRALTDRIVATIGTCALFLFFAFSQLGPGGNYTFIAPYSHEMTHGTALAIAALVLTGIHLRRGGAWAVGAIGLAVGMAFLTKPEFVIAVVPAVVVGLAIHHRARRTSRREVLGLAARLAACAIVPPAAAFVFLLASLPLDTALRGVAGSWPYLFADEVRNLRFYREILGTLDLGQSLLRIATWSLRYAVVLVPAALAGLMVRRSWRAGALVVALLAPATASFLLATCWSIDWENLANPFPLITSLTLVGVAVGLARRPADAPDRPRRILAVTCLIYSLGLLLKMFFNTRILHYGYVLAMPAGLALVGTLLGGLPAWLDRRGRNGAAFRSVVLGALAAFAVVHLAAMHRWLGARTLTVGTGADAFVVGRGGEPFVDLLNRLRRLARPGDSVVVLPEGVMLNYLLRMENPTPYVNFMPPEMILFGEQEVCAAFAARPPDWIVVVNRSAVEYGYRFLGDDYGRDLLAWVEAHYEVRDRIREELGPGRWGPFAAVMSKADRSRSRGD